TGRPVLTRPLAMLKPMHMRADLAGERAQRAVAARMRGATAQLAEIDAGLRALAPSRVLERGYSITRLASGGRELVRSVKQVTADAAVSITVADGEFGARVVSGQLRVDFDE
ncbi:MAG: exodeoxyribonuclease VII large subunit, partial [Armatimonadetes bacterium]|nr:exodeoxyribonuclease VII large subunit [Armatimonadota bacterium]